jgi:hypothetical protein
VAGSASPSDYTEFWFDSPHGPAITVSQFTGGGTIQASTGGGNTFFSGDGTPVRLATGDGFATITNPDVANGSGGLPRFTGTPQATAAPGASPPVGDENQLAIDVGPKDEDGSQVVSVDVTDPSGTPLGNGQVLLPDGGWWVIGLGPGMNDVEPPPDEDPIGGGDDGEGDGGTGGGGIIITPIPVPGPPDSLDPTAATPEPASLVLLGFGGLTAATWRRLRRK